MSVKAGHKIICMPPKCVGDTIRLFLSQTVASSNIVKALILYHKMMKPCMSRSNKGHPNRVATKNKHN